MNVFMLLSYYGKEKMESIKLYKKSAKWLFDNLEYFDPRNESKIADNKYKIKAFMELLFVQNMFYPQKLFSSSEQHIINNFIINLINNMSFYNYAVRDPDMISVLPTIIEFLLNQNQQVYNIEKIEQLIEYSHGLSIKKTAFRRLDLAYSFKKAGLKNKFDSLNTIYPLTTLGKNGNNFYYADIDVYSITHTIFYMTDMGRKATPEISTLDNLYLLLRLIQLYILEDNMDILSELLICIKFLHYDLSKENIKFILDEAVAVLKKHQKQDGLMLGPGVSLSKRDTRERIFRLNYHTTMVSLGALYLYE